MDTMTTLTLSKGGGGGGGTFITGITDKEYQT